MKTIATLITSTILGSFLVLAPARAEEGLVLHYDFNEGTGTVLKDQSGHERDGKINGAEYVKESDGYALNQRLIDEVRIYNRALTEAEVTSHYQAVRKAKRSK